MSIFEHQDFDSHQLVAFHEKPEVGLKAIIAVHNTNPGQTLGGAACMIISQLMMH